MGYRIVYDPEQQIKYPAKRNSNFGVQLAAAVILFVAIAVLICNPVVSVALKNLLLPGDPMRTDAAIKDLVAALRAGETVKDSITAFCLEILHDTQL